MSAAQSPAAKTCRVVQWATGNVGARSLRTLIEHPDLELVGLYVYGEAQAGRDAGELFGLPSIGVKATRNIDEILALTADCGGDKIGGGSGRERGGQSEKVTEG